VSDRNQLRTEVEVDIPTYGVLKISEGGILSIDSSISLGVNLRTQMAVRSFARADRPDKRAAHSRRHIS